MREELTELLTLCLSEYASDADLEATNFDGSTVLYGDGAVLDSLGLVMVVTNYEQQVNDRFGKSIVLADERAMSMKRSPFRSVEALSEYAETLLREEAA